MRRGRASAGPGDGCRGCSSGFQFCSKWSSSCFRCLLALKLLHTVRAGPSVGVLLPTAQFGKIHKKVEIHVFHLPVAVPTIALDIAVLACSGDQTHERLHTKSHRIMSEYKTGSSRKSSPSLLTKNHDKLQLIVLDSIPNDGVSRKILRPSEAPFLFPSREILDRFRLSFHHLTLHHRI